jgi:hypothetical protein
MAFDIDSARSLCRRTVHAVFGAEALFKYNATSAGIDIRARYHNGLTKQGLFEGEGAERYADISQVVFNREDLASLHVAPERGNVVEFVQTGVVVMLDVKLDYDGPVEEKWLVTPL